MSQKRWQPVGTLNPCHKPWHQWAQRAVGIDSARKYHQQQDSCPSEHVDSFTNGHGLFPCRLLVRILVPRRRDPDRLPGLLHAVDSGTR